MKKKPIYLWVLLVLSAINSAWQQLEYSLQYLVRTPFVLAKKMLGHLVLNKQKMLLTMPTKCQSHPTLFFNTILIILSAILVVVAFVFLIRKNLQLANYTYVGYALLAIIGLVHDNMNLQDAMQLIKDDTLRLGMEVMSKATTIIFIVINVIFWESSSIKYGVSKKN